MRRRSTWLAFFFLIVTAAVALAWSNADAWGVGMIVGASAPEYAPRSLPLGVREAIEIESRGARVRAWVLDPEGPPRGTVFLLHGIHDSKASLLSSGRQHARRGVRVVLVDSRGHGESSGRWLTYGVHESEDLARITDALQARGLLVRPLAVVGSSYGGATAVQYGSRDPRVAAVVALSSFSSLREVVPLYARRMLGPFGALPSAAWLNQLVDEAGDRADFDPDDACPRCVIGQFEGALLLIHGREDARIPWTHSAAIRDAATEASAVRLEVIDGAGHLDVGRAAGVPELIAAWLDGAER